MISDVLFEAVDEIIGYYIIDEHGHRRTEEDGGYPEEWIQEKLLPVLTAMHTLKHELESEGGGIDINEPLLCPPCQLRCVDVIELWRHFAFDPPHTDAAIDQ